MVEVLFDNHFKKIFSKIKDVSFKEKIYKQFVKIRNNPEIGKPMKNVRKNTREVYIKPYRLSYKYDEVKKEIIFLDLYHKDKQ